MFVIKRSAQNPIIAPDTKNAWEARAAYNPCAVSGGNTVHLVYRAVSPAVDLGVSANLEISSIGYAVSENGIHFKNKRQLVKPEEEWEKFGCEDPRVTKFEGSYYIFYTALSTYPFSAAGIKVGVAVTKDWKKIEKHPVTPFNAKAMALFPERVNGKIAIILTVNTDNPPAKICIAFFDTIEDIWSESYWKKWYVSLDEHVIDINKGDKDQIEVGAVPIKTSKGWLFFYSYIYNYFSPPAVFGVQALLLDLEDPKNVIGEVKRPFLVPDEEYELYGRVPSIVFPSGAIVKGKSIYLYYGAADTTSCVAMLNLKQILEQLVLVKSRQLKRFVENPIIAPLPNHAWEAKATFNPAALYEKGKVHLLYRAMSDDNTSVFGYATSADGLHIDERLFEPVYVPSADFEMKLVPGGNSGCEDPRLTKIGDTIYMCYTAYDGAHLPRVALTSISLGDFLSKKWNWAKPILISPIGMDDKDAALFPKKISGKYVFLHRLGVSIWIDCVDNLEFKNGRFLGGKAIMNPRESMWDSRRIGIAGPPIETEKGWLLLYHGISKRTSHYSVRAALLDLARPERVLCRTHDQILESKMAYEKQGIVSDVVFPCGTAVIQGELFVYYGGADKVVGVATIRLKDLVDGLSHEARFQHEED
ncbi:MAG: hypothetical protein AAB602_01700 [Patescibacteria group bacterium]